MSFPTSAACAPWNDEWLRQRPRALTPCCKPRYLLAVGTSDAPPGPGVALDTAAMLHAVDIRRLRAANLNVAPLGAKVDTHGFCHLSG